MSWQWIRPGNELLALSGEAAYQPVVRKMRDQVTYWKAHFQESTEAKTGWGHNYVCPDCAGPLTFDRDKPQEHRCPACGITVENTRDILEAHTYYTRYEIGTALFDAAVLYRMERDETDKAFVLDVIGYYAAHYAEFSEYGSHAGRGRVMGQSLDEAVWGVNLLRALMALDFDGRSALGQQWHHQLFLPMARLVMAQSGMIHNIPLWHAAYAMGAAILFGDERLLIQSVDGELGVHNQVLKGFTADGIWYENATGYHTYALHAATHACCFARYGGHHDPEVFDRVIKGYTSLLKLRFRNDTFPAFNDTGRTGMDEGLRGLLDMYVNAAHLFEGMPGAEQIAAAVAPYDTAGTRSAFLYGAPDAKGKRAPVYGSVNLAHNCMAMLRSKELEVFVKYGNLLRSHAHADALEICIPPFIRDLGTSGYGSPYHAGWYVNTAAHATFAIDGQNQRFDAHGQSELSADGAILNLSIAETYEGVHATRQLELRGPMLRDTLHVACKASRQIDWFLHGVEDLLFEGEAVADTLPETENGYGYLADVRRVVGPFTAAYRAEGKTLHIAFGELPEGAAVYLATSPDYPADRRRHTILIRVQAQAATIAARYSLEA